MKKWLLLIGVGGLVAWWKRHSFIPAPEMETGPAPRFRTADPLSPRTKDASPSTPSAAETTGNGALATAPEAAPEPSTPSSTDDLQRVNGIGPVYARRLNEAGVSNYAELVAADSAHVAEALDVATEAVDDWKTQARDWI